MLFCFGCAMIVVLLLCVYMYVTRTEADDKETAPATGQVALRFLAAPINVSDLSQIQGTYAIKPTFPAVAGNEGVAVVTAVGEGVTHVKVNDRVIPTGAAFGRCF